ncbi:IS5 family transposase [Streptomyces sp. HF10]|uniref:IS5 family transposase n=1 Tax=Streptomyces sp. HF10 TaxID=2692233 RepID=UPI0022A8A657|nr:IS5 family transposase [Streptomyces sp. HF10]
MDHDAGIRHHELSDADREFVRPLLRGRKRVDDRRVPNGTVWKFRTGTAWRDVPERYGPRVTPHTRFRRWAADGTFDRMLRAPQAKADAAGDIEWLVSVDSTIVRARQLRPEPEKGAPGPVPRPVQRRPDQQDPPGLDGRGRPLTFVVTGGNTNDRTRFTTVMEAIRVPRIGPGRPRIRPERVVADKGYSSTKIRTYLRRRGIKAAIPERIDQVNDRIRRGENLCRLVRAAYRRRNVVEHCFNKLKHNKALATRYDKRARRYQAMVAFACLHLWLP